MGRYECRSRHLSMFTSIVSSRQLHRYSSIGKFRRCLTVAPSISGLRSWGSSSCTPYEASASDGKSFSIIPANSSACPLAATALPRLLRQKRSKNPPAISTNTTKPAAIPPLAPGSKTTGRLGYGVPAGSVTASRLPSLILLARRHRSVLCADSPHCVRRIFATSELHRQDRGDVLRRFVVLFSVSSIGEPHDTSERRVGCGEAASGGEGRCVASARESCEIALAYTIPPVNTARHRSAYQKYSPY
jgi:hypothetical protein